LVRTYQLLACVDNVNYLKKIHTPHRKKTSVVFDSGRKDGLEANAEKTCSYLITRMQERPSQHECREQIVSKRGRVQIFRKDTNK
jgi:hypothetical protein